jgi:hypothetical protein
MPHQCEEDDPDVKGLGAHNATPGRPGWTPEGNKAARSILAWGGLKHSFSFTTR